MKPFTIRWWLAGVLFIVWTVLNRLEWWLIPCEWSRPYTKRTTR